jgi:alpha 1,6-mannosyltransferase
MFFLDTDKNKCLIFGNVNIIMKVRRIRYNRMALFLLFIGITIFLTFLLFQFYIWYLTPQETEINSLKMIEWSSIPIYVPKIPKNVIQTSKYSVDTNNVTNSFIRLNPTYKYIHYNDSTSDEFVRLTMPDYIYQTYISLPKSIMKADYFRYIVLLVKGGVYTDIDTICLRPIDTWINGIDINNAGLIIGIEADVTLWEIWQGDYARQIQFLQWTIAAAPGHPILHQIVKHIADISPIMAKKTVTEQRILEWTGPAIWTDIISNYFLVKYGFSLRHLKNLNKPMFVGEDIYVLPITAFSPGLKRIGSKSINDSEARVQHLFAGSWKNFN